MKVLISPAHYILDTKSQSEFYASAMVILGLAQKNKNIHFSVICGKYNDTKESLPNNITLYEIFPGDKELIITIKKRIQFYILTALMTGKILYKERHDVIWHMLPNGLFSFNPAIFFQVDRLLNKNIKRILGRLQYTDLPDLKNIKENNGKILHKKNSRIELYIFSILKKILGAFSRYYFELFSFYIFNNKTALDFYQKKLSLQVDEKLYKLIPVGVDVSKFSFTEKTLNEPLQLLFTGNLTDNKRVEGVIEISKILRDKNINFETHIIGNGDEFNNLLDLTEKYSLKNNIHFHGDKPKSEMPNFHKKAHFLFLLSKSESFGQVLLESWASGTIFIGSNIPALEEMIDSGKNGFIVDMDKTNYAEDTTRILLSLDDNDYKKIALKAQNDLIKYKWENVINEYSKIF